MPAAAWPVVEGVEHDTARAAIDLGDIRSYKFGAGKWTFGARDNLPGKAPMRCLSSNPGDRPDLQRSLNLQRRATSRDFPHMNACS